MAACPSYHGPRVAASASEREPTGPSRQAASLPPNCSARERPAPFDVRTLIDQIGNPDMERILLAAALAESLPAPAANTARAVESAPIGRNNLVLIDLWARLDRPDAIYHDITWVGYAGLEPPPRYREVFEIVRDAREHGVEVRPPDINASTWDNIMEPDGRGGLALRLGFRRAVNPQADRPARTRNFTLF